MIDTDAPPGTDPAPSEAPEAAPAEERNTAETFEAHLADAGELGGRLVAAAKALNATDPDLATAHTFLAKLSGVSGVIETAAAPGSEASELLDVVEEVADSFGDVLSAARGAIATYELVSEAFASDDADEGQQAAGVRQALREVGLDTEQRELSMELSLEDEQLRWTIEDFVLEEWVNAPYKARFDVTIEAFDGDLEDLLGKPAGIRMDRGNQLRAVQGIVTRVEWLSRENDRASARLEVRPALYLLSLGRRSRIFQGQDVLAILSSVLEPALAPYRREVRFGADRSYPVREHCVQYQESDLAFVHRLMAEEGLSYFFEEGEDAEVMIVTDHNDAFPNLEPRRVGVVSRSDLESGREGVSEFLFGSEVRPAAFQVTDYDWTRPDVAFVEQRPPEGDDAEGGTERLVQAHESALLFTEYDRETGRFQKDNLSSATELGLQREMFDRRRGSGAGDVLGFAAGVRFELTHSESSLEGAYLAVAVRHHATRDAGSGKPGYENAFDCIPADVRCVPRFDPTLVPRVSGFLTATVTGPEGEEIYTDKNGRIQVRFNWDQESGVVAGNSCWVRLAQSWSGPNFGTLMLPRVGMEVVIQFEGGRLDRPLCIGCVYNGANAPPLVLPEERTQTVLRTASTPGGDGYNELRFEDAAGQELMSIHAQRDRSAIVRRDDSVSIGGAQTTSVSGKRTVSVEKEQIRTVGGEATDIYAAGLTTRVDKGSECHFVNEGAYVFHAKQGAFLSVDGSVSIAMRETGPCGIELAVGSTTLTIEDGKIVLSANGSMLVLSGDGAFLSSEQKVLVNKGADATLSLASTAALQSLSEVNVTGGAKVVVTGGGGTGEFAGGVVKLN